MTNPRTTSATDVSALPWFLNPYLHLLLNGLLIAAAELLMKRAANATASIAVPTWLAAFGVSALGSWWIWAGIVCYILAFALWLHILRFVPLSIAFPLASISQVLVPLGAWFFLRETIHPLRWCGIGLVMVGIWLIAERVTQAEEAL